VFPRATTPAALWASPSVTEIRLGASEGHYVIDILATEAFKYAQVESGAEPFVLTFFLLDTTLAFPAVTREVNEGPLRQVVARYSLAGSNGGPWQLLARGTTIGFRKLDRFPPTDVRRVRLSIEDAVDTPRPVGLALYAAP